MASYRRAGLPSLPPRRSFATQDGRFAERRRAELEAYLRQLLAAPDLAETPEVQTFLGLAR